MNMANRIKQLRIDSGMTQDELGKALGLQKSAVAKYESGRVENIKRSIIKKMADLFGVEPSYIMCLDNPSAKDKQMFETYMQMKNSDDPNLRALALAVDRLLGLDKPESE